MNIDMNIESYRAEERIQMLRTEAEGRRLARRTRPVRYHQRWWVRH